MKPAEKAFLREVIKATECGLVDWTHDASGLWTAYRGGRRLTFAVGPRSVTLTAAEGGAALASAEPDGDLLFALHMEIMRHVRDAGEFRERAAALAKRGIRSPGDALDYIRERTDKGRVRWKPSPGALTASVRVGLRRLKAEIRYRHGETHPEPESVALSCGGAVFEVGAALPESKAALLAESAAKSAFGGLYSPPGEGGRP